MVIAPLCGLFGIDGEEYHAIARESEIDVRASLLRPPFFERDRAASRLASNPVALQEITFTT
jgi:hypothetical protein